MKAGGALRALARYSAHIHCLQWPHCSSVARGGWFEDFASHCCCNVVCPLLSFLTISCFTAQMLFRNRIQKRIRCQSLGALF